jgi:hypothetical protein
MDRTRSSGGLTRRTLLGNLSLGLGAAALSSRVGPGLAFGAPDPGATFLVIVNLFGGNDTLNTYVPYGLGAYYDVRARIGVPPEDVLPVVAGEGLHPSLAPIHPLWAAGDLAVVRQVGYPDPNLSHFESADIWSRRLRAIHGRRTRGLDRPRGRPPPDARRRRRRRGPAWTSWRTRRGRSSWTGSSDGPGTRAVRGGSSRTGTRARGPCSRGGGGRAVAGEGPARGAPPRPTTSWTS